MAVLLWSLTGFLTLGVLATAASRSRPERIWSLVSLVVAFCFAVLALGPSTPQRSARRQIQPSSHAR